MTTAARRFALASLLSVLFACQRDSRPKDLGAVEFALAIPGGARVDAVQLHLVCPASGVDLAHTLDVRRGEVVATFGGLMPGSCVVTMQAVTDTGARCAGNQAFTVVARELVKVVVPLFCQGTNDGPAGRVTVAADFMTKECAEDRIRLIYAIPGNVRLGESTQVEVQVHPGAVVGQATFMWAVRNEVDDTGQASLSMPETGACHGDSAACMRLTCDGLGDSPTPHPVTGRPHSGLFVAVTYQDDDCFDTEELWLYCVQDSVCGDGVVEGGEQCEDGNRMNDDGCSADCRLERCGDGILQANEECDGALGLSAGQMCSDECRRIDANCGDGVVNHPAEECDGSAGIQVNQVCGPDCLVVPICGNGILERGEACDSPADAGCVNCREQGGSGGAPGTGGSPGGTGGATATGGSGGSGAGGGGTGGGGGAGVDATCRMCIGTIDEVGPYTADVCEPDATCANALTCLLRSGCWVSGVPAQCYCGPTPADLDNCETPSFVPRGPCASELLAGAGAGASNADVLNRYFDIEFPTGRATIIVDSAFLECQAQCF